MRDGCTRLLVQFLLLLSLFLFLDFGEVHAHEEGIVHDLHVAEEGDVLCTEERM